MSSNSILAYGIFMSQKAIKPVLSGQRLKNRKRDEKEKYDPSAFRTAIILGLDEAGKDIEGVLQFFNLNCSKLDYRRYAEVLFDILLAGGQLAPGGLIVEEHRTTTCVFKCDEDLVSLKAFYDIFYKLIRRYKYLERAFQDDLTKVLLFQRGFHEDERRKLAIITGLALANNLCNAQVFTSLFDENMVKEGMSLDFATLMFQTWIQEKDINHISSNLKKSQMEGRLMELFPSNKRNKELFMSHFRAASLAGLATFQEGQLTVELKKELQKNMAEMINEEQSPKDIIVYVREEMQKSKLTEQEVLLLVWSTLMSVVEWNKKEELIAEQALKHLKTYTTLLGSLAKTNKSELALVVKVQDYCYDNMNFLKVFHKIIVLFYKADVVSEDVILSWYKDGHSSKGKTVFLEQMKKFIEWLQVAEEESDEEEEEAKP